MPGVTCHYCDVPMLYVCLRQCLVPLHHGSHGAHGGRPSTHGAASDCLSGDCSAMLLDTLQASRSCEKRGTGRSQADV